MRADWLAFCRDVASDVEAVLLRYPTRDDREPVVGQGRGGDDTTVIDKEAERVAVARLEALEARGIGFLLVSEELGERRFGDPESPWIVVLDPIDGSLNAKRGLPFFCISIAFADGPTLDDVRFGFVKDFGSGEEWVAEAGSGSHRQRPSARRRASQGATRNRRPRSHHGGAGGRRPRSAWTGSVGRIRLLGALALALCQLADGRVDGVATLKPSRSVDLAAAALIVREAGATLATVDADVLGTRPRQPFADCRRARPRVGGDDCGRWCTTISTTSLQ